jgi:hypothetical protein
MMLKKAGYGNGSVVRLLLDEVAPADDASWLSALPFRFVRQTGHVAC